MASTSGTRTNTGASRMMTTASTLQSDNQSLIGEIRKGMNIFKDVAVDLEGDNQFELVQVFQKSNYFEADRSIGYIVTKLVKELEAGFIQLLEASEDCMNFSSAIQSVANGYEPGEGATDFKKLIDDEMTKLKPRSSVVPQKDPLFRQFTAAIWNVHHAGQPMPGEEEEDIIMTSTQSNLLNTRCPLSGKPITALSNPVRSMDCKHIYEKMVIMEYLSSRKGQARCPITGCPKMLRADRVVCDPLLQIEIEEMQAMSKETGTNNIIEDVSGHDEDEEEEESG